MKNRHKNAGNHSYGFYETDEIHTTVYQAVWETEPKKGHPRTDIL